MPDAERPEDLRCPVWRCPLPGARWVVLHEHWRLAVCDVHADDVDQHPEAWQIVAVRDDVLRIARTGEPAPSDRWEMRFEGRRVRFDALAHDGEHPGHEAALSIEGAAGAVDTAPPGLRAVGGDVGGSGGNLA